MVVSASVAADDVTGLLIAALAASILHADRPWQ
jgi:hypothetical protein